VLCHLCHVRAADEEETARPPSCFLLIHVHRKQQPSSTISRRTSQTPRFPCDIRALREERVRSRSPRLPTGRFCFTAPHIYIHILLLRFLLTTIQRLAPALPSSFAAAEHPHPPTVGFRRPKDRRPIHHREVRSLIPRHCIPSVLATSFLPPCTITNVCCFLFPRGNMRPKALPARPACTVALPHGESKVHPLALKSRPPPRQVLCTSSNRKREKHTSTQVEQCLRLRIPPSFRLFTALHPSVPRRCTPQMPRAPVGYSGPLDGQQLHLSCSSRVVPLFPLIPPFTVSYWSMLV
jgi:hypothetical protein